MDDIYKLIHVYAGQSEGSPIHEELPALVIGDDVYQLLASPGLALNLAKGDLVKIIDSNKPAEVVQRGGNFCIQAYGVNISDASVKVIEDSLRRDLQGSLDGLNDGNLSFSVPAAMAMDRINAFFDALVKEFDGQWFYSNIYKNFEDPDDQTLDAWWHH